MDSESLSPQAKSVLKVIFITLFIDLIGFSIIFPLFPAILTYYVDVRHSGVLAWMTHHIGVFSQWAGVGQGGVIVLFGGLLTAVYSLLQFVCAPILGAMSDRYGRRPILMVAIGGIAVSYLIWFLAGSFELLVLSRLVGGMMSGNISAASAAVADTTPPHLRSKGMAIMGMAFGLGFILGPALGGLSAHIDLAAAFPGLTRFGVNPFSAPALVAMTLSLVNLFFVYTAFSETRPPDARAETRAAARPVNPLKMLGAVPYPGVNMTNAIYFIFITAFSGIQFSLVFLAAERFGYGAQQNAMMMVFLGVMLALVQGSYVQRFASRIGPKRMVMHGLATAVPACLLVGYAPTPAVLYVGLFVQAAATAQTMPCLTALVSLYTPVDEQGRVLGIFRSLGALSRAAGPLVACLLYWRLGAATTYYLAAAAIVAPLVWAAWLPDPHKRAAAVSAIVPETEPPTLEETP